MSSLHDPFQAARPFRDGQIFSLPALEEQGLGKISRLPVSIRVVLESVLRNCDGQRVTEEDVRRLAGYNAKQPDAAEIPFVVSRIVLQDFTGVPLLVDLAAMRDAVKDVGGDPAVIEPLVPVDLVVDHSVQVDRSGTAKSFAQNLQIEFERNRERYEFLKWGQQAFETFAVVPPAIGIVHQVNLEYLAKVVFEKEGTYYPDTLVGTDSHTTMINGLGIVGWGVGGIEAEAGMLGQPIAFQTPEVIGVHLSGELQEGVTATDLTLRITQLLREHKVVGKFVEFYGEGAASLTLPDRATIANMAPEYGATMGFFPIDDKTLDYMRMTGRSEEQIQLVRDYFTQQGLYGVPRKGDVDYTKDIDLDLSSIVPSVSGPKRPQDRIEVPKLKSRFEQLLYMPAAEGGFGITEDQRNNQAEVKGFNGDRVHMSGGIHEFGEDPEKEIWSEREMVTNRPATETEDAPEPAAPGTKLSHGSVVIAAITSCTNTSNPSVMLGAGLVAKKAVEKGLNVNPIVKTSLAPGSRVVTEYLNETGLQTYLDQLGFNLVGYGCTTCIGNSGPLDPAVEKAIEEGELVVASVLSGNRNFEARIHGAIKSNFLMSPPLVVAYALAGRVDIDLDSEPIGTGKDGQPVYLKDIWPTRDEIEQELARGLKPSMYVNQYSDILEANPQWKEIESSTGDLYEWKDDSTYIQLPPFFEGFGMEPGKIEEIKGARPLGIFGDSVTTDHISPAGSIPEDSPAGRYLIENGVEKKDFNSYGSRRGNDRVMTRGTFANVRIKNLMAEGREGGYTKKQPDGDIKFVFDACMDYREENTPLVVFGGVDYGMGSSRDWAAKGTNLLGVKAVIAKSFERIHRSNLIGMGVLPLEFANGEDAKSLGLEGTETYDLLGLSDDIKPGQEVTLKINKADGSTQETTVKARLDTNIEVEYYRHGGILTYVLRQILQRAQQA
ncbi:MAG: aconitate hydratase 1 [Puniceicoccaceae bacterium 5H]|nr:MAG: aconitate hydratase 1 [Puniceicoccaceae bacterium 5H]